MSDVKTMLTNITRSWLVHALQEKIRWQSQQLAHAQRAYDLVETRYNAGGDGLLTVLEVRAHYFAPKIRACGYRHK
jgi:outer membrane protein, multidrug efflux system